MTRDEFYAMPYDKIFPYIERLEQRIAELEEELLERISESNMYCKKVMELESSKTCCCYVRMK